MRLCSSRATAAPRAKTPPCREWAAAGPRAGCALSARRVVIRPLLETAPPAESAVPVRSSLAALHAARAAARAALLANSNRIQDHGLRGASTAHHVSLAFGRWAALAPVPDGAMSAQWANSRPRTLLMPPPTLRAGRQAARHAQRAVRWASTWMHAAAAAAGPALAARLASSCCLATLSGTPVARNAGRAAQERS